MKLKNKKAFTLVELIATIVILGVIMIIAIPNVLNIIDKNKKDDFIEAAKLLVTEVEYKVKSDQNIELPKENNKGILVTLNYLKSNSFENCPYEYNYSLKSFVLVAMIDNKYEYFVHLTSDSVIYEVIEGSITQTIVSETANPKNVGINLTNVKNLYGDNRFNYISKGGDVEIEKYEELTSSSNIQVNVHNQSGNAITVTVNNTYDY